jgi:hypothetical protein|tara:strand:+ start:425 stop:562 length:138 start_codon:yes stop_codon:yes gene_type:complete
VLVLCEGIFHKLAKVLQLQWFVHKGGKAAVFELGSAYMTGYTDDG